MSTSPHQLTLHRTRIAEEAARFEEDTLYASKSHFNDAISWERGHLALGVVATLLAGAAGTAGLFLKEPFVGALVSFLAAGTAAVLTFQKPSERAQAHRNAGAGFARVHRKARQLRLIDAIGPSTDEQLRKALDEIEAMKATLDAESPGPSGRAFRRARTGIEKGEASHVADDRVQR